MIISLNWLSDYVSLDGLSVQELANTLTSIGLEVENIKETALLDSLIVLGKIIEAKKHPNADALKLCRVDIGGPEILDIVCGGVNAREGIYVAVAQKGAVLPDGLKIKASKIRGEASNGMLCSQGELFGTQDESHGILEWSKPLEALGTPVHCFLQNADAIFELNVTPNRSDCLSYIGVARDLAAKLERPLKAPGSSNLKVKEAPDKVHIHVDSNELCARFTAVMIKKVKALASPSWMQKRLEASGVRSVNLIVDATNYVMLEYGQPIHAYDRRFVEGDTLRVSSGKTGTFQTLDASEIQLVPEDILICDAKKIVGLAGIMGGKNSEIKDDTNEVIIEVAHFNMQRIRKTAKRLALHSDASHRFQHGVDIANIDRVLQRVSSLIIDLSKEMGVHAELTTPFYDHYPVQNPSHKVALRLDRARMMLANPVLKQERCISILQKLGFVLCDEKEERMLFEVPTWRHDIQREIDLIEEVGRLEAYDSIPYEIPRMSISGQKEDPYLEFVDTLKRNIALLGLHEIMTYPFTSSEDYEKLGITQDHGYWPTVSLANALNERQSYLQTTTLPGLLQAVQKNRNRGIRGSKLFEVSRTYFSQDNLKWTQGGEAWKRFLRMSHLFSEKAKAEPGRVIEREMLGVLLDQPFTHKEWNRSETTANFFHVKDILNTLLKTCGVQKLDFVPCEPGSLPFLHPHASAWILMGRDRLGYLGELHPETAHTFDLGNEAPVYFELDLETVYEVQERSSYKTKSPARYPSVIRDLAVLLPKEVTYKEFHAQALKFPSKKHLVDFRLFDLYEGEKLGDGMKSFAASCTFQSYERTLTDQEVESEMGALLGHLKSKLGAVQR